MKKCINGVYEAMTADEITAMEQVQLEQPSAAPTAEERLAALESAMLAMLGGGLNV